MAMRGKMSPMNRLERGIMPKTYYIFRNEKGYPAVGLHFPRGAEVLGMAASLDAAKDIQRSMREQDVKRKGGALKAEA